MVSIDSIYYYYYLYNKSNIGIKWNKIQYSMNFWVTWIPTSGLGRKALRKKTFRFGGGTTIPQQLSAWETSATSRTFLPRWRTLVSQTSEWGESGITGWNPTISSSKGKTGSFSTINLWKSAFPFFNRGTKLSNKILNRIIPNRANIFQFLKVLNILISPKDLTIAVGPMQLWLGTCSALSQALTEPKWFGCI